MTVLERTIQAYTQDAGDDVVWSNWAYPLAAAMEIEAGYEEGMQVKTALNGSV